MERAGRLGVIAATYIVLAGSFVGAINWINSRVESEYKVPQARYEISRDVIEGGNDALNIFDEEEVTKGDVNEASRKMNDFYIFACTPRKELAHFINEANCTYAGVARRHFLRSLENPHTPVLARSALSVRKYARIVADTDRNTTHWLLKEIADNVAKTEKQSNPN